MAPLASYAPRVSLPSEGVQTAHGPAPRLAEGAMQRQPVQARVGYPAALPSPRLPRPEVRQRV